MSRSQQRRLRRLLWLSAVALFAERLWPRLWPLAAVVGGFLALALSDLLPQLSALAHVGVLVAFAVTALSAAVYAWPALRPVDRQAAMRRLDRDAAPAQRPLAATEDRLATGEDDPLSVALWTRHRQRMAAAAQQLRVRWPAPDMARHEPWGIRAFVVLLLVIGAAAAGGDWQPRLLRAVSPAIWTEVPPVSVELWISPPAYTRRPPIFLRAGGGGGNATAATPSAPFADLAVPVGSRLEGRVTGTDSTVRLQLGDREVAFKPLASEATAPASQRVDAVIETGDRIVVRGGYRELAAWPLRLIADGPPTASFLEAPAAKGNGLLALAYQATDDYGISAVNAIIRPEPATDEGELRLALALTEPGAPVINGHDLQDLSAHPWAGRAVSIRIEARDGIGQTGLSAPVTMTLPQRTFSHPVAKAIIAERSRLEATDDATRQMVAGNLDRIAANQEAYAGDVVVALGLAIASARLQQDHAATAVASVRALLWDLALRLEDGGVPAAERRLQAAREQLMDALQRNTPAEELARLMDQLRDALNDYLAEVAAEVAKRQPDAMPMLGEMQRAEDLQALLNQAAELARTGSREAAQALLGELQRMLDGIRLGLQQGATGERLAQAAKTLEALKAMAAEQQALLDRMFQRLRSQQTDRRGGRREGSASSNDADLQLQRGLRQQLGDLADELQAQLGGIPDALGAADQGMRDAIGGMAGNRMQAAVDGGGRAVDALNRALDQAGQSLAQQLSGVVGVAPGSQGGGDPFGRSGANGRRGFAADTVKIPEQAETERVQDLLRELRRRAGERDRSGDELRYIERLLRQF